MSENFTLVCENCKNPFGFITLDDGEVTFERQLCIKCLEEIGRKWEKE